MPQRAIRINDSASVIVTFRKQQISQLTSEGLHDVTEITALIYTANDLGYLSAGTSLGQPEDGQDDIIGMRLALRRALDWTPFTSQERAKIYEAFLVEKQNIQREKEVPLWWQSNERYLPPYLPEPEY